MLGPDGLWSAPRELVGYEGGAEMFTDAHKSMRLGFLVVLVPIFVALVLRVPGMGEQDFLIYWSAARLLAAGENPYDPVSLQNLQYETRPERAYTLASWNPPWLLVILIPLGLILAAAAATWRLLTGALDGRAIVAVSAASLWFLPSLSTMNLGQISSLVLIGLVLGSWWLRARRDGLAGAAFFVATVKPHVTYFAIAARSVGDPQAALAGPLGHDCCCCTLDDRPVRDVSGLDARLLSAGHEPLLLPILSANPWRPRLRGVRE